METSVSGFKVQGSWAEIVEHGERITRALAEAGLGAAQDDAGDMERALSEWETWRPKAHEELETEVRDKTAEQASLSEGQGEQAGMGPGEDLAEARTKLGDAVKRFSRKGLVDAVRAVGESLGHLGRAVDSAGRKTIRSMEGVVYRGMTRAVPFYFDNELVSADISRVNGSKDPDPVFVLEVNINDDELKQRVASILEDMEDPEYEVADQLDEDDAPSVA